MIEKLTEAQDIILNQVNQICRKLGLNNIMAKLYAILYLNDKPMSLNDMVDRLRISKGSVSINIRALERYKAARKVWVKGSRKDYYEAEPDIVKVIIERVRFMANDRLSEIGNMTDSSYEAINAITPSGPEEKKSIESFKKKINTLRNLHNKTQSILNLFNSGLFLGNLLKLSDTKTVQTEENKTLV